MNIHKKRKTGCKIPINHCKNVCKNTSFTIQIIEKWPGNGCKNESMDHKMLEYCLQQEDYWVKTLHTIYPYGLNKKTKVVNKNVPVCKFFPPLPWYWECYL